MQNNREPERYVKYHESIDDIIQSQNAGDLRYAELAFYKLMTLMSKEFLNASAKKLSEMDKSVIAENSRTYYAPAVQYAFSMHSKRVKSLIEKVGSRAYEEPPVPITEIIQYGKSHLHTLPFKEWLANIDEPQGSKSR